MADTKPSAFTQMTASPAASDGIPVIDDYGGSPTNAISTLLNLFKVINEFTEDTAPDRTTDYVATYDASVPSVKKALLRNLGAYEKHAEFTTALNPADATTYYWGAAYSLAPATTGGLRRMNITRSGIIVAAHGLFGITATGTTEDSTVGIRLNNTTNTVISSTVKMNATPATFSKTDLAIAVTAGDYIECYLTAATFVTNPTGVYGYMDILIA